MPITIKDIAKAAGVSHTTVSRALKGNPVISDETTERIQQLAEEMGYVPNTVAQSLLSRQTNTIGMVLTSIADPFMTQVVEGVEKAAQAAGFNIFLSMSHNNPDQEIAVVDVFQRRRVDAIIVTSSRVGTLYSTHLNKIQIPVVLVNNQEEGQYIYSVAIDDRQGAQLAVRHLIELGHHHIGYLGAPDRPKSNRRRMMGYQDALTDAGIPINPALNFSIHIENDLSHGEAALDRLLKTKATAVFCYNDMSAIGLQVACWRHGVLVPQDLSVVGFDDLETAKYATPPLTTIHQPRQQLGQLAMSMVLDLLNDIETNNQRLACELVVRESTGPVKIIN